MTGIVVGGLGYTFPQGPQLAFTPDTLFLTVFTSTQEGELSDWFLTSWDFAKKILPLLLFGEVIGRALLGLVGHEGLIPSECPFYRVLLAVAWVG